MRKPNLLTYLLLIMMTLLGIVIWIVLSLGFIKPQPVQAYTMSTASNIDYFGGFLMDVYYPSEAGDYPLIIYIHGGSWEAGSRSGVHTKLKDMVSNDGYVVASIDYGLAPSYDFPSPMVHLGKAIEFLKLNASSYKIDVERIGLYGDSVGGTIASLYTLEYDYNNDIDTVIMNSSPTDLKNWDYDRDADAYTVNNATSIAFQGKIDAHIGYNDSELRIMASPYWSDKRLDPDDEFLVLHTYQDPIIPRYQSKKFVEMLRVEGYYIEYKEATESGHVGTVNNYWDSLIRPFILNYL